MSDQEAPTDRLYDVEMRLAFLVSAVSASSNTARPGEILACEGSTDGLELMLADIWSEVKSVREVLNGVSE